MAYSGLLPTALCYSVIFSQGDCDGLSSASPSVETACADSAVEDPEIQDGGANPCYLPGLKGARPGVLMLKNANQGRRGEEVENGEEVESADDEENMEDSKFSEGDDKPRKRDLTQPQERGEGEDVTGALIAAQEAHSKDSSHASGEAWQRQGRSGTG
ncbi:hypothetical protein NDU88_001585 [Pleurodeles waltl]|uniref:Uncharacterized protein n=2 Tax=Pleurodeles waltl TaxID=8319 RepID=A0AAV7ND14_PLEWA|nr:hypothetical protein NDU88_000145 [Pleurodeles waltl]KAJ1079668.1 hypothetical protein NDU88_000083 [Pleurodeles waltl]KAJ1113339.1 hypothetical protein NDU88_001585 [Pleurodeles waltl]